MPKKKTATKEKTAKKAAPGKGAAGMAARPKGAVKKAAVRKKAAPKKAAATNQSTTAASPNEAMIVIAKGNRAMHEITQDLHAAGFQVGEVLEALRQVTGHAPANLKSRLKKIRGVEDVTPEHPEFNIGLPGAPVS